jgi:2-succinyl-5-enolpyruvyl-6-hydroxy-3-cyclohexene-1-carboxylate synthase
MTATHAARLLVDELVRCGIRDAVLAPGSRNAPISYALAAASDEGRLRLHVRIDERSAAFLALGLAKASGQPVPVCCTSGTAAGNFLPAVLEASESGIPLVVLTADRPPELRGVGANQTINQAGLYGGAVRSYEEVGQVPGRIVEAYVRTCVDRALGAALGTLTSDPGPVHLNVPLREPLTPSPDEPALDITREGPWTTVLRSSAEPPPVDPQPERTLVVMGDAPVALGARARALAERHGWPLIAEPSSGARGGPLAVPAGALVLTQPDVVEALLPQRVLVVGRPTLTRHVQALLRDQRVRVEVRAAGPRWADAGRQAACVALGVPEIPGAPTQPSAWAERWLEVGRAAAKARDDVLGEALTGPAIARALIDALPAGAVLAVGSSLPVRDLDLAADELSDVTVLANRGVAGIDGTVSTAVGTALASAGRPAYALIGDLTFLHDLNGLLIGPGEPRPDLCLVVVDNDGGGIFATLEQGTGEPTTFERIFGTPTGADLAAAAAVSGTSYTRVETLDALREAVKPQPGLRVVHVPVTRDDLATESKRLSEAIAAAVRRLL